MEIIELAQNEMVKIKSLWKLLNQTHYRNSNNWKKHFKNQTFDERFNKLQNEKYVFLLAAKNKEEIIAYCFTVADEHSGEIASIYVVDEYRNQGVARQLILKSIDWLNSIGIQKVIVGVAEGNEHVLPFYEKFGFKKSATVLKLDK